MTRRVPHDFKSGKVRARSLEYSVAYHCNLRCAGCSHMSPFVQPEFPSLEGFTRDVLRLRQALHVDVMRLLGGEPLLNPELPAFLRVAKQSRIADRIVVTTNGLLLHRVGDEFWENLDVLLVTRYPGVQIQADLARCRALARAFDVEVWVRETRQFQTCLVTEPHPGDWLTDTIYDTCTDVHEHHCHMLHEGVLYRCAVPPFLPQYLAALGSTGYAPAADGLDLERSDDLAADLQQFLTSPETPECCRYCLGSLGQRKEHRQMTDACVRDPGSLGITRERDLDRMRLMHAIVTNEHRAVGAMAPSRSEKR